MTESDYIIVTNHAKLKAALAVLSGVLPGDDYGISEKQLGDITSRLIAAQENLYALIKIESE